MMRMITWLAGATVAAVATSAGVSAQPAQSPPVGSQVACPMPGKGVGPMAGAGMNGMAMHDQMEAMHDQMMEQMAAMQKEMQGMHQEMMKLRQDMPKHH